MKQQIMLKTLALFFLTLFALPVMSQGIIVYKNDGTQIQVPYESLDSIVTYKAVSENITFSVNGVNFTMVAVKGGTFTMGAPDNDPNAGFYEYPAHYVTLSDYYIGETEVTQALWKAVMGNNPSYFNENLQRPVEMVSWEDCQTFISKLNELTGEVFSLPTEAQWEYAARGGKQSADSKYAGSNSIDNVAWYNDNSSKVGMTHPDYGPHSVKTKAPNELGIYDMTGNVFEWCADWYGNYPENAVTNPAGPGTGDTRVTRGGGWQTLPERSCVYSRYSLFATSKGEGYGLRLVLNSPKK